MKQRVRGNKKVATIEWRSMGREFMHNSVGNGVPKPAGSRQDARPLAPRVTVAEQRVLRLVSQAKTNKEIAMVLGLSPATVKRHLEKILNKLGLRNRVELAIYGLTPDSCPHHSVSGCALRQFERDRETPT